MYTQFGWKNKGIPMAFRGNRGRYGSLAIALHWVSAIAILVLLVLGFRAANAADSGQRAALLRLHVPLGTLVLFLTVTGLMWWLFDQKPDDPAGQQRWQTLTAHAVHALLYLALIVMGISGIGLLILSGASEVLFFGASGPLPRFSDFPPMIVHAAGAFAIVALLCFHVGAALYHQFYKRDHLLARMGIGSLGRQVR